MHKYLSHIRYCVIDFIVVLLLYHLCVAMQEEPSATNIIARQKMQYYGVPNALMHERRSHFLSDSRLHVIILDDNG